MNTKSENQEKSLEQKFEDLIEEYKKENNSNDFLLFDLANANENAHTKVLLWLLSRKNKGKYIYLPSFLQLLGIDYNDNVDYKISGQEKAIGNKGTGFIDLYIEGDGKKIIIENKIYGAADTDKQLARYVATVQGIDNNKMNEQDSEDSFGKWYKLLTDDDTDVKDNCIKIDNNIYVVYLTADGTKIPDDERKDKNKDKGKLSLPPKLETLLDNRFIPINYDEDIFPWLNNIVIDKVSVFSDQYKYLNTGLFQYIEYLRSFLSANKESAVVRKFISEEYKEKSFRDFMYELKELYNKYNNKNKKEYKDIANPLFKEMMSASERIFFKNIDNEWCVHVLLTCIILYKRSWADLDKRKYTIPTLHLVANNSNYLKNEGEISKLEWALEVDHLKANDEKIKIPENAKYTNHGKTFWFKLKDLKLNEFVSFKNEDILNNIEKAIEDYGDSSEEKTPKLLLNKILEKI